MLHRSRAVALGVMFVELSADCQVSDSVSSVPDGLPLLGDESIPRCNPRPDDATRLKETFSAQDKRRKSPPKFAQKYVERLAQKYVQSSTQKYVQRSAQKYVQSSTQKYVQRSAQKHVPKQIVGRSRTTYGQPTVNRFRHSIPTLDSDTRFRHHSYMYNWYSRNCGLHIMTLYEGSIPRMISL